MGASEGRILCMAVSEKAHIHAKAIHEMLGKRNTH